MINLKTFAIFENNYSYKIEDVKNLTSYKILQNLGFYDVTSDRIWNNGNIKLQNDVLKLDKDNFMVLYGNGYLRGHNKSFYRSSPTPYIITMLDPIQDISDWNNIFVYLIEWTKKRYKKLGLEIPPLKIGDNWGSFYSDLYNEISTEDFLFNVYDRLKDSERDEFLKASGKTKADMEFLKKLLKRKNDILKFQG